MWIGLKTLSQHFQVLMLPKKLLSLLILLLYLLHNSTTAKMDLKQKYPRTSSFNQLKNQLNIQQACLLSNEREELCNGNDTFLKQFFFLLYDYHQTAEISFNWRAVLRRQLDAFKNCVARGGGRRGEGLGAVTPGFHFQASAIVKLVFHIILFIHFFLFSLFIPPTPS